MLIFGVLSLVGIVSYFVFTAPVYCERQDSGLVRFA